MARRPINLRKRIDSNEYKRRRRAAGYREPRLRPQPCRHCGDVRCGKGRGLCWKCYYTPGIKELYPITSKFARRDLGGRHPHDTVAARPLPEQPTDAVPGTAEKVAVLAARVAAGESLFRKDDERAAPRVGPWEVPVVTVSSGRSLPCG